MDRINWKTVFGVVGVAFLITFAVVVITVWVVNNVVTC